MQEGAGVGIKVVMTGDRSLLVGRMSTLFDDKLMLRMVDASDFGAIGMTSRQVPSSMVEGRGFRAEGLRETQVAQLAADSAGTAQVAALQEIARAATSRSEDVPPSARPFRVDLLPVRIGMAEALALGEQPAASSLPVAVGGDTLGLRALDAFEHGPAVLVTGSRRSGRSTALRTMATFALRAGWQVVLVTPRMSPLRDLVGAEGVHGPFDAASTEADVKALFERLRTGAPPVLTLVDDVELVGADGWLPTLLADHIDRLRDSGSMLAAAGTPAEMGGLYRGPVAALKRSGSGIMLSPQATGDADLFGARLSRSAIGQSLPPGAGFLMRGGQAERVQVIWPE
jgi:S-DNA-T family DNA segregation ATPase FtsK/SpoIIIE